MDFIQRGPVWKTDSDGDSPLYQGGREAAAKADYEASLRRWRESAREEALATAKLNPELDMVQKYVNGIQGEWWDKKRARYKSRFFDNRLDNTRQTDLALLTDTRPTIDVSSAIDAYKEQSVIVQKIIAHEWLKNDMDLDLVRCADITKLNGTGFWKVGAAAPGMMQVISCGPESVLPIQPGFHLQQSTAVLYRTWKALSYYRNKFPYQYAGLEREAGMMDQSANTGPIFNRPAEIPSYTWNGLSPQMRRAMGVRVETPDTQSTPFKTVELQEYYVDDPSENESPYPVLMRHPFLSLKAHNWWYWVKPGQRLYPRKRMIVYAGRRLMYDGPAPFWHGLYPFACMRLNPVPWSFWGLSKYRNLMPLNGAMNEIGAGIMDMIKRALNPTAISKQNAVAPAVWKEFYQDMPGSRLLMLPNASISDIRYMDPPNIPAWVLQWHQYVSQEFDRVAGNIDVGALGKKKQVPGGDTIEQMRDLMNSTTRLEGRYIEAFLRDAGILACSNAFQFYEMPLRLRILGADGISFEDFNAEGPNLIPDNVPKEDHWRNFAMTISPGSLLNNGSKDREKQIAMNLTARGILPVQELYRRLEIPDPAGMYKMLLQEHKDGEVIKGKSPRGTRGQRNGMAA